MPKTHTVKVSVPQRQQHHGYYVAQRHLPPGKHTLEGLTDEQLREVQEADKIGFVSILDASQADSGEAPTTPAFAGTSSATPADESHADASKHRLKR